MATLQEKVLARVRGAIEAEGFELSDENRVAINVGKIRAMKGLGTAFVYSYSFQSGYMSADLSGPAVDHLIQELGVETRTYPQTRVTIEFVALDGEEFRVEDCTGVRGIALPPEMRKRYIKWYHLEYQAEKLESMIAFVEELAMYAARDRLATK